MWGEKKPERLWTKTLWKNLVGVDGASMHTYTIIYYIQDLYDQFVRISVSISEVWHKVITQVFNNFEYIIHVFTFRCIGIMDSLSGEETNLKGFFFSFGEEGGIKKFLFS